MNIQPPSAPVNGDATPTRKNVSLLDYYDQYGDLIKDGKRLAWAKSQFREAVVADRRWTPAQCRILIILIERFNGAKGYAWPSHAELAESTGVARMTAIRAVAAIEASNWIIIKARGTWRGGANEYLLNFDMVASIAATARGGGVTCSVTPPVTCSVTPPVTSGCYINTNPTLSENEGLGWTDAGRSPPDGGRARAGEVAPDLFQRLWALPWVDKSFKALNAGKRAVDETKARADAPPDDLLVAKAASYLANVPRAEQRWLSFWLRNGGWRCDESPPKPDRASKANGKAAPDRAAKPESARGEFESEHEYIAREAGFPVGTRVRDKERGRMGKVFGGETLASGKTRLDVTWDSRDFGSYVSSLLEVVEPAPKVELEPPSPVQLRAKEAGLMVGTHVRDVADHEDEDYRREGVGRVTAVGRDGYVYVRWSERLGDRGSYREDFWNDLQVVAP